MSNATSTGVLTGSHYLDGDHACSEGAIAAGCRFSAGVVAGSSAPGRAKELIAFLASPDASAAMTRSGLEPIAGSTRR